MALLEKPDRERGYSKERILRVLLNHTEEELTKYRVAKLAKVSEPWTRQYTDRLEEQGLLKDTTVLKPKNSTRNGEKTEYSQTRPQFLSSKPWIYWQTPS